MAYARRYVRKRRTSARNSARKPARATRYRRKSGFYPRIRGRTRVMSKRRILNTSSRKKRNGMLTWSNTNSDGSSKTIAAGNAFVAGNALGVFVWSPTVMDIDPDAYVSNPSIRSSKTIYARGVAENIRIQTSSGLPWFHRRICFTTKGSNGFRGTIGGDLPLNPQQPFVETSSGFQRLFLNTAINNAPATLAAQLGLLFKGQQNVDWSDPMIAPVDTSRVTIKFDKTWTLQSGNSNGVVRERKLWHPMNSNLVYDDDENGRGVGSSWYSTASKAGMGDYYIVDLINGGAAGTVSDTLLIQANSTMYWHEK